MKKLTIGILAHVDAGKTTLSEALLCETGVLRQAGRVDAGNTFLDTDEQERQRGITIFSKQAVFRTEDTEFTLLDTPGHVDFSAETERTLQVLDAAILVISAPDGVQSHTVTLWRLLQTYRIPVFIFVNKMDQIDVLQRPAVRARVLGQLNAMFRGGFFDFGKSLDTPEIQEDLSLLDETLMERYLEDGTPVGEDDLRRLVGARKLFPCWFGFARELNGVTEGVKALLSGLSRYAPVPDCPEEFGARIFKITRDEQGSRLTWMKITGGTLRAKMVIPELAEKADQLRLYNGKKFTPLQEAPAGTVVAVTGLTKTRAGEGLGTEQASRMPLLSPVLRYRILLPEDVDAAAMLPKLRSLEEEEPELHILWDEESKEIRVQLMGEVQTEILKNLVAKRFNVEIGFDRGSISYRETITDTVEGVGHFEPLRHYAEVHLILSPGEPGSGLVFESSVSSDRLATNWQRLILTHLEEKEHLGVLTGAPITDMKITVADGKAHLKHTEGGDFRQATYRAVRNGLMYAQSILLEPWYEFTLEVPASCTGRALTDLDRMAAEFTLDAGGGPEGEAVISGKVPVSEAFNYMEEVRAYTKGTGRLSLRFAGYFPCHDQDRVIEESGYDPELDLRNSPDSVFCSHGVGQTIPWYDVRQYMHLPAVLSYGADDAAGPESGAEAAAARARRGGGEEIFLSTEEIDAIISRTFFANRRKEDRRRLWGRRRTTKEKVDYSGVSSGAGGSGGAGATAGTGGPRSGGKKDSGEKKPRREFLLADGYNIIFAWEELNALAKLNIDSARLELQDILSNYQGYRGCEVIIVFDAYRVAGHQTEVLDWQNIHIVFTKEAQTADSYIEQFSMEHAKTDRVVVATSDGLEQIIVQTSGSELLSARELRDEVIRAARQVQDPQLTEPAPRNRPMEDQLKEIRGQLKASAHPEDSSSGERSSQG